jgi:hypothetical protein
MSLKYYISFCLISTSSMQVNNELSLQKSWKELHKHAPSGVPIGKESIGVRSGDRGGQCTEMTLVDFEHSLARKELFICSQNDV